MRPFSDQHTSSGRPYDEQPTSRGRPQDQFTDHHLTISDVLWTSVCCLGCVYNVLNVIHTNGRERGYIKHLTLITTSLGSCCQRDAIIIADIQQLH